MPTEMYEEVIKQKKDKMSGTEQSSRNKQELESQVAELERELKHVQKPNH